MFPKYAWLADWICPLLGLSLLLCFSWYSGWLHYHTASQRIWRDADGDLQRDKEKRFWPSFGVSIAMFFGVGGLITLSFIMYRIVAGFLNHWFGWNL